LTLRYVSNDLLIAPPPSFDGGVCHFTFDSGKRKRIKNVVSYLVRVTPLFLFFLSTRTLGPFPSFVEIRDLRFVTDPLSSLMIVVTRHGDVTLSPPLSSEPIVLG